MVAVFRQDVEKFLRDQNVRFVADARFLGISGFHHPFDFVIPKSEQNPERYVRAVNNPSRESIVAVLFAWQDIQAARAPASKMVTVLNDEGRQVSADNLAALGKYGIETIQWSERDNRVTILQD